MSSSASSTRRSSTSATRTTSAGCCACETVTVSDGRGRWRTARWRAGGLEADGEVRADETPPGVTIAAAIPKGDRLEWMAQKLTEVGVGTIVLVDCARSVVRWK